MLVCLWIIKNLKITPQEENLPKFENKIIKLKIIKLKLKLNRKTNLGNQRKIVLKYKREKKLNEKINRKNTSN